MSRDELDRLMDRVLAVAGDQDEPCHVLVTKDSSTNYTLFSKVSGFLESNGYPYLLTGRLLEDGKMRMWVAVAYRGPAQGDPHKVLNAIVPTALGATEVVLDERSRG